MDGRPNRRNIAVFSNSQAMQMTAMPTDNETLAELTMCLCLETQGYRIYLSSMSSRSLTFCTKANETF